MSVDQATRTLTRDEETKNIPVIVCSVLRERDLAFSLGATDFLAKPISQHALHAALGRCLAAPEATER